MASPNLLDVIHISGDKKMSKVIKAAKTDKKVKKLVKKDKKVLSAKEVRNKLYGEK